MKKLVLFLITLSLTFCFCACEVKNDTRNEISVNKASTFSVCDYIDPETGVHYLLYKKGDSGGICPRYNADGTLMVSSLAELNDV